MKRQILKVITNRKLHFFFVTLMLLIGAIFFFIPAPSRLEGALPKLHLPPVGTGGQVGCGAHPQRVSTLTILRPGIYENFLIDGNGTDHNLVKILVDNVTLRHCEIRNGIDNGIVIAAKNVIIDSCKIHHLLKGSFRDPKDAHGITGHPVNLLVRNCEIFLVSGDAIQFSPSRKQWGNVLVENCTLWSGKLTENFAQYKRGECPGENAVDTKQWKKNFRSRMTIRRCLLKGWDGGRISNQAALNIKENVQVTIENCVFRDNNICMRLRGPAKRRRGGAHVTINNCAAYFSKIIVRKEDKIRNLKIYNLGIGDGIGRKYTYAKAQSLLFTLPLANNRHLASSLGLLIFRTDNKFFRNVTIGQQVSSALRSQFAQNGIILSAAAFVAEAQKRYHRLIRDNGNTYLLKNRKGKLEIHGVIGKGISTYLRKQFSKYGISLGPNTFFSLKGKSKWIINDDNRYFYELRKRKSFNEVQLNVSGLFGYQNKGEYKAPPYPQVIKEGLKPPNPRSQNKIMPARKPASTRKN